jgi:hypothetical protein
MSDIKVVVKQNDPIRVVLKENAVLVTSNVIAGNGLSNTIVGNSVVISVRANNGIVSNSSGTFAVIGLSANVTTSNIIITTTSGNNLILHTANDTAAGLLDAARSTGLDQLINNPFTQRNSDWNATSGVTQILNKPSLANVAFSGSYNSLIDVPTLSVAAISGSYNDLSNKPAIPSATTTVPSMDSTGTVGTSVEYARADHIHPSDTTRATLVSPAFSGSPTAPTQSSGDNSTKLATTAYLDRNLGINNGIATLDASGKLAVSQIPTSLVDGVVFKGVWNADLNSPHIVSGVGIKGNYYKVNVAGTTSIDGITQWNIGDSIIFDGTVWDKINGLAYDVISVVGLTGDISANALKAALALSTTDVTGLATVAVSGSYNDLSNRPTIPSLVNSDWSANSGPAQILNRPNLATVAVSGSYNDLSNRPTYLAPNTSINLTVGYTGTAHQNGTITDPVFAPSPALGEFQTMVNDGTSFVLNPPTLTAPADSAGGAIMLTNGTAPGDIDLSAWSIVDGSFTTNADDVFICIWLIIGAYSAFTIKAV